MGKDIKQINKTFALEINQMANIDQKVRAQFYSQKSNEKNGYKQIVAPIDKENTERLKEIITEVGYPTISKVGKDASFNAWLIVQHSPDIPFMEHCLDLMKKALDDINPQNIAYLEDRLNMFKNKPQQYGTQLQENNLTGRCELYKIADIDAVNKARKSIGLGTIEEYLAQNNL